MQRISRLTLLFSVLFAFFLIAPGLLSRQFAAYPLIKTGDVVDLFTPLVLLPLYWLLFQLSPDQKPTQLLTIIFMVLAAAWASGQGMHLAANSIGHLLKGFENSDVYTLTYFYDEILSHYIWHMGIVGLSILIMVRQWLYPFSEASTRLIMIIAAGLLYGLIYFVIIIEAGTAPLGVTTSILVSLVITIWGRKRLRNSPLLTFFYLAYILATLLFFVWAIYWGGLPQFSEVGLID